MDGKVSQAVWKWIAFVWMCIEIGQFIEYHASLNKNELFWPFWTCLTLVILLGAHLLDLHFDRQRTGAKSNPQQEAKQVSQKYK